MKILFATEETLKLTREKSETIKTSHSNEKIVEIILNEMRAEKC